MAESAFFWMPITGSGSSCRATIKVKFSVNQDETAPCVG